MRREIRRDLPRARGFLGGHRRAADEDARARRRFLRRRRVERPFDANRADVREEREAGRRSRLQRVAHEMLIEISPSEGKTCLTRMPPRVPNGRPSMW